MRFIRWVFQTPVFVVSTAESTAGETVSYLATATPTSHKEVDDVAVQEAVEEVAKAATHRQDVIRVAHVMSHEISHGEPVRKGGFSLWGVLNYGLSRRLRCDVKSMDVEMGRASTSP